MKLLKQIAFLVVLIIFFSGCVFLGKNKDYQPFDADELENLVCGETTMVKVCELFGAPNQVVKMLNGNACIYRRSVSKGTVVWLLLVSFGNAETQHDRLVFFFNKNNILTHYGVSLKADQASYGLPF